MTEAGAPRPTGWVAHVLAAAAMALALVAGFYAAILPATGLVFYGCVPDFSEATIIAPASYRGLLVCGVDDGELGVRATVQALFLVLPLALLGISVVVWVRRRRVLLLVVALAAQAVVPGALVQAVRLVPAECTAAQQAEHGADGCERSEERRPGLGLVQGER